MEGEQEFKVGDCVRLSKRALKDAAYKEIGPRVLIEIGWPNEFYIERIAIDPEGNPAITLSACCCNLVRKGEYRCKYHPAHLFEKIDLGAAPGSAPDLESRVRNPGDREAVLTTPFGDVASLKYFEDEKEPGLVADLFGKRFLMSGAYVREIYKFAQQKGIL